MSVTTLRVAQLFVQAGVAGGDRALASQFLQEGAIGFCLFVGLMLALLARFAGFLRSGDDSLAFVGVLGLALIVGFIVKNLTDDFLFRSNAREFWATLGMLLGVGVRRSRDSAGLSAADGRAP